ncbi:WD repeat-containing protein 63 [Orussus abietinus]|uniref:WD repeat-containing protein 63 n=1 Tax=Orussus abietinus TaxID=222816 RepID=UPI000C715C23|nr:WD repeat-containing protein 63 [Orussus abietinus]
MGRLEEDPEEELEDGEEWSVVPRKEIRFSTFLGAPGIARIDLTPLTRKIVGCVVGENVTTEYPWIYVKKEVIEDNLDLHDESSDFLPVKDEIQSFPDTKMLIGYAPSSTEEGQFYICLTEEGRDAVMRHIEDLREEQERRVSNAVYKSIGTWKDLGSGEEVDDGIVKKKRPLFLIEVESTAELLEKLPTLVDSGASDRRDGYIELVPRRGIPINVTRRTVEKSEQASPAHREATAQTSISVKTNAQVQYRYEYQVDSKKAHPTLTSGLKEEVCDQVLLNATWDLYTNDYANLVRHPRDTEPPVVVGYTEHQSFSEGKLCVDKTINDLSWHPLWTGIAVVAYADHGKSQTLEGPPRVSEVSPGRALVWSFSDALSPKLILESHREVTAVSVCPLDGNVIVGGCVNGQLVIWHIPGKIELVEAVVVHTSAQVKYRIALRSLMTWMKESIGSSVVRPAATSSLTHSQRGAITQIRWLPSHNKIDKNGRILTLPEDTPVEDLAWQFATCSEDGTVAFWDLKWQPPPEKSKDQSQQRGRRSRKPPKPEALAESMSPFKVLDGIFKPEYLLVVKYPDSSRRAVLTAMSTHYPSLPRELVDPIPPSQDNVAVRKYYRYRPIKPDFEMVPELLLGTDEGDRLLVSWEGFEFTTGVVVNRETCRWTSWSRIHDGLVASIARSRYIPEICATVGGKIFAIWRQDFEDPVFWRRCLVRYTACCWGSYRPSVLIVGRADGTVEVWDFLVKSHEPTFSQSVSGRVITGIYTHELFLDPQCVGICDYNGTLRIFLTPRALVTHDPSDVDWMRSFMDREVERIRRFKEWQSKWNEENQEWLEKRKELAEVKKKTKKSPEAGLDKSKVVESKKTKTTSKTPKQTAPAAGKFLEDAKNQWLGRELNRMQRVILDKKGLKEEDLEKQRAPVTRLREAAKEKKRKIGEILRQRDKIFEDTVAILFPERKIEESAAVNEDRLEEPEEVEEEDVGKETRVSESRQEERGKLVQEFLKIQAEALAEVRTSPHEYSFDWRKILADGKARRRALDLDLPQRSEKRRDIFRERSSLSTMGV